MHEMNVILHLIFNINGVPYVRWNVYHWHRQHLSYLLNFPRTCNLIHEYFRNSIFMACFGSSTFSSTFKCWLTNWLFCPQKNSMCEGFLINTLKQIRSRISKIYGQNMFTEHWTHKMNSLLVDPTLFVHH